MTVVIVTVVTVTEVIFTYLPIWRYVGTVMTVVTVLTEVIKKMCFHKKKLFSHKNHLTSSHKKSRNLLTQKTLRELQKAALRVGRLSRCWGDKKNVTKLKNSNCQKKKPKTQIMTKLKNSNCDKTQKLKLWQN